MLGQEVRSDQPTKMTEKYQIQIADGLNEAIKVYNFVDDSLLLQAVSQEIDIFDMFSDFSGMPIDLLECLVPHPPGRNTPFLILYGVHKSKWSDFRDFIEQVLSEKDGKKYGPYIIEGKTPDIKTKGKKYGFRQLIPVYLISVINYTDSKVLTPIEEDEEFRFSWSNYSADRIKENRRRSPISKSMRFEILQRDNFTCQYCKRHKDDLPHKVKLTLDHKIPYSDGGDDSFSNLVTACGECNAGKSNKVVNNI